MTGTFICLFEAVRPHPIGFYVVQSTWLKNGLIFPALRCEIINKTISDLLALLLIRSQLLINLHFLTSSGERIKAEFCNPYLTRSSQFRLSDGGIYANFIFSELATAPNTLQTAAPPSPLCRLF